MFLSWSYYQWSFYPVLFFAFQGWSPTGKTVPPVIRISTLSFGTTRDGRGAEVLRSHSSTVAKLEINFRKFRSRSQCLRWNWILVGNSAPSTFELHFKLDLPPDGECSKLGTGAAKRTFVSHWMSRWSLACKVAVSSNHILLNLNSLAQGS